MSRRQTFISNPKESQEYFRQMRWHGCPQCPRCRCQRLHRLRRQRFRCGRCRYEFGEFTGTYLGQLRLPLDFVAHLLSLFIRGVPACGVRRYVPVSVATAERAFRIFRQAIYDAAMEELSQVPFTGGLELDGAAVKRHRRGGRGWGTVGRVLVFGIYQRDGCVVTFPVPHRRGRTPGDLVIHQGGIDSTGDSYGYVMLTLGGKHQQVTHKGERFVPGRGDISPIEGFWSYGKGWLCHYRGVPRRYFPLYLKEIEWRFNHRYEDLFPRLAALVTKAVATV